MSAPGYKIWHCSYEWYGRMGAYQQYECVVTAEIKDKALGMALTEYADTSPSDWTAVEIPSDRENVHHISSASS